MKEADIVIMLLALIAFASCETCRAAYSIKKNTECTHAN